jgi:hypothetical protein
MFGTLGAVTIPDKDRPLRADVVDSSQILWVEPSKFSKSDGGCRGRHMLWALKRICAIRATGEVRRQRPKPAGGTLGIALCGRKREMTKIASRESWETAKKESSTGEERFLWLYVVRGA